MDNAVLLQGDCLEVLKELPDNSVDSLVTDPPAFIDFMSRSWDGTDILWRYLWSSNTFVSNAARFLKRVKIEGSTEGQNTVPFNASSQKSLDRQGTVRYAKTSSDLINPNTRDSVELLVLTKLELLDLLKESLPSLTTLTESLLSGDADTVSYAIPLILPKSERTNTVPKSVLTNIKKQSKSGQQILLTSMDVARIKDAIEDRIGIRLESQCTRETNTSVSVAKSPQSESVYNVITLSPTSSQEIIPNLTLLLSALVVTEKSKNIQSYLASNFMECVMTECLRVMKPGAHGLVWAIPRTSHWTATALEDAGFNIREVITHCFGSGFPKSMDISKAIDKAAGAEREEIGPNPNARKSQENYALDGESSNFKATYNPLTAASTPDAKRWQGWGTALKPASEHWILIRKPLSEKTVAANVLRWGCGGLNIDASRIGLTEGDDTSRKVLQTQSWKNTSTAGVGSVTDDWKKGRFPANLLFSHNPDCVEVGVKKVKAITGTNTGVMGKNGIYSHADGLDKTVIGYASPDGTETVSAFECTPGCAVSLLDRQSGTLKSGAHKEKHSRNALGGNENTHGKMQGVTGPIVESSVGGASRFFYCAKASKRDKNGGLEGMPENEVHRYSETGQGPTSQQTPRKLVLEANSHPTVKSTTLMAYLIRLVTPPGGLVLDPFAGSGSTGVSAVKEGFAFIGIEKEQEYYDIASKRIEKAS